MREWGRDKQQSSLPPSGRHPPSSESFSEAVIEFSRFGEVKQASRARKCKSASKMQKCIFSSPRVALISAESWMDRIGSD